VPVQQANVKRQTCSPKPTLGERPLLDADQSAELVRLFKLLANDARLSIIHALAREDELCVTELAGTVGMSAQAVSNQLQRLVSNGILASRRNGNNVHYRIVDPCVTALLDLGLCLSEESRGGTR